jgi:hypothetical protein
LLRPGTGAPQKSKGRPGGDGLMNSPLAYFFFFAAFFALMTTFLRLM